MAGNQPFALITGAAGGIGRALVDAFHAKGYRVIATDMLAPRAELPVEAFIAADLKRTVEDEVYAAETFGRIRGFLNGGRLKALINNAAVQILGGADDLTRSDWQTTLDVNLLAPFFWTQAFLPELEAAKGGVVNISSIHAHLTKRNYVAYATSKAALSGLTRCMAVDLGARVRINAIEPAAIETDMLKAGFESKPELYRQLESYHPQNRIGQPQEIAALAIAMVEDNLGFLQGACITMNGGIGSRLHDPD